MKLRLLMAEKAHDQNSCVHANCNPKYLIVEKSSPDISIYSTRQLARLIAFFSS
jgi:hypothetical protein